MTVMDPETMQPVPADGETMGEIMFRGNITMKGYLKNPTATDEAFARRLVPFRRPRRDAARRLRQDPDRSKDIIISGGENISLARSRGRAVPPSRRCSRAAVVASPTRKWGETPCAFVELKPGASVTRAGADRASAAGSSRGSRCRRASCSASCRRPRPARSRSSCCASEAEVGARRSRARAT